MEEKIQKLKDTLSLYGTRDILGMISMHYASYGNGNEIETNAALDCPMLSPYQQYLYLAGLLISTEEKSDKNAKLSIEEIQREYREIENTIQNITIDYEKGFLSDYIRDDLTEEERKTFCKNLLAMGAFVSYFENGPMLYPEQIEDKINLLFAPFSKQIETETGLSVESQLSFYHFINERAKKTVAACNDAREKISTFLENLSEKKINRSEFEKQAEAFKNENLASFQEAFERDHIVLKQEIISEFGEDNANRLLDRFVINRKSREFKYYNEKNPFKDKPLCFVGENEIFVTYPPFLLNSIYERLISVVDDPSCPFRDAFQKKRGDCVEKAFYHTLQLIFGNDAKYHENVCEAIRTDEHDLVIEYKDFILICEAKASKVHEPFFNPEKGYERLKRQFNSKSGIGYAYNQALKLKKFLDEENSSAKTLYENRNTPFEIDPRNKKILPIVFTLEHFGLIEINASELLEKDDSQPYPWICCLPDLKNIKKILDYAKKTTDEFIDYIDWRVKNHRRLIGTIDELDILEAYLYKPEIRTARQDFIHIVPNTGPSVIDKIYFEEQGYKYDYIPGHYEISEVVSRNTAQKGEKVGRNAPCPCGSGKKYKKCCLGKGIYDLGVGDLP